MTIMKINKSSILEAVAILKRGGIVVYPTETAYALGADATNEKSITRIFKIKNRPKEKNLPVICHTKKQVEKFFELPAFGWKLWLKFYPKPLSIILKYKNKNLEAPVRISSCKTARDLARKSGRPITATSANISGGETIYDSKDLIVEFSGKKYQPDLILDAGKLAKRPVSTIIKLNGEKIEVLRRGEVKI
ncbi:MAG: L-threonylcarbamoyladenylate synthase [Patescibacteria group bacterium]